MVRTLAPLAVSIMLLAACSGGAQAATHSWQITDVTTLRVDGPFDVHVHTGQSSGVRATGPQAAIDHLIVEQQGETLVIHPTRTSGGPWGWSDRQPLVIEVGVHMLDTAMLTGSGDVTIDRLAGPRVDLSLAGSGDITVAALDTQQAKLAVGGSGDMTVAGRARAATATVTGSGDLHAARLIGGDVTANLTGSGNLAIGATASAAATLTGSGDIAITGPARCTVKRSGSGNVACGRQATAD